MGKRREEHRKKGGMERGESATRVESEGQEKKKRIHTCTPNNHCGLKTNKLLVIDREKKRRGKYKSTGREREEMGRVIYTQCAVQRTD
jgi:hypothetical protein